MNDDVDYYDTRYLVFGLGSTASHAVEYIARQDIFTHTNRIGFVVADTDINQLDELTVPDKLQLSF